MRCGIGLSFPIVRASKFSDFVFTYADGSTPRSQQLRISLVLLLLRACFPLQASHAPR